MRDTTKDVIRDIAVSAVTAVASALIFEVLLGLDDFKGSYPKVTKETTKEVGGVDNGSSC